MTGPTNASSCRALSYALKAHREHEGHDADCLTQALYRRVEELQGALRPFLTGGIGGYLPQGGDWDKREGFVAVRNVTVTEEQYQAAVDAHQEPPS